VSRRITFTVEPSDTHHDVLTIQDAFQQAIDFFNLLTDEANPNVVWKLELASTNSPFMCQGEPVDVRTWAGAHGQVEQRVEIVERNFRKVAEGGDFDASFPREKLEMAKRLLRRNTNGIGRTKAAFSERSQPIVISQTVAKQYFERVEPTQSLHSYLFSRTSRRERGSVEGRILEIGTDYDAPAIQLKEHNTDRLIWCRVSPARAEELAAMLKAGDVWDHRRVRVHGTLNYDSNGNILRVVDGLISYIDVGEVDLSRLDDTGFTEGYSPSDYLDRLREGEFG
jgi:hypothetical protein